MKLDPRAAALAGGILWAVAVGGVALIHTAADYGGTFLQMAASIYPGFAADGGIGDALVGTGYALVDGAIAGLLLAWLYNLAARGK
ncbi:MAG: hypothetical protein D6702_06080 [Planctomycetota bacterium]|nr:MAG: hypothetical protein D6702_06080 [Planctomycetota bacterium]